MISAAEALERLREGNRRFTSGDGCQNISGTQANRAELAEGQSPFAVVLACSDSRVPVELVFDQGLGDLFVIRVAGNIATPPQIGSVEFAATQLGTRLVVVLGHSNCGAIDATIQNLAQGQEHPSPNLRAIIERIRPAIESLPDSNPSLHDAVIANVRHSVRCLQHDSQIIKRLVESGDLTIIGAEYSIDSGEVGFLAE
jgi:carbonic anhydrase